jgi:hypothetical protein
MWFYWHLQCSCVAVMEAHALQWTYTLLQLRIDGALENMIQPTIVEWKMHFMLKALSEHLKREHGQALNLYMPCACKFSPDRGIKLLSSFADHFAEAYTHRIVASGPFCWLQTGLKGNASNCRDKQR